MGTIVWQPDRKVDFYLVQVKMNFPGGLPGRELHVNLKNTYINVVYWYIPVMHGDLKVTFESII
jgi:hypothetical protein